MDLLSQTFREVLSGSNSFISSVFMDIFDGASRIHAGKVSSLAVFSGISLDSYQSWYKLEFIYVCGRCTNPHQNKKHQKSSEMMFTRAVDTQNIFYFYLTPSSVRERTA